MTEQQLQVLAAHAAEDHLEADGDCPGCFGWTTSALGLVAEVRRLRGLIWDMRPGAGEQCLWCSRRGFVEPHTDCPAFTEAGEVR